MTRTAAGFAVAAFVGLGGVVSAPLALADTPAGQPDMSPESDDPGREGTDGAVPVERGNEDDAEAAPERGEGDVPAPADGGHAPSGEGTAEAEPREQGDPRQGRPEESAAKETPEDTTEAPPEIDPGFTFDGLEDIEGDHLSQKTYAYTCTAGGTAEPAEFLWTIATSGEVRTGRPVFWSANFTDRRYHLIDEPFQKATFSGTLDLGGPAAPQESLAVTSIANGPADGIAGVGPEGWNMEGISGRLTPRTPGELTFTPGTVTITVEKASGTTTTTCTASDPDVLTRVRVTGDDLTKVADHRSGAGTGAGSGAAAAGDKAKDRGTGPAKGSAASRDALPVTGPELDALVAAGAAAVGVGAAAMYLARRRETAVATSADEA
ncbi:hypothetical protein HNR23_003729 [Nocardiopsis mwathae]|uniref:LPXTG cell wall anchor domain-containing protein n=1 Tax=Nocardiopsis mwathae TaxID=1472723 RepID=A0A7W9YKG8_9ACTN|nr:hypothetical protein [Nocardiopsis mwathae]MBB6173669.1 hypothetical protein [Nocardiopsis mwathae]